MMGGEDFGIFGLPDRKIPVCMFWLGAMDPSKFAAAQAEAQAPEQRFSTPLARQLDRLKHMSLLQNGCNTIFMPQYIP